MNLTPGQAIHINLLILQGKNEEAVQYLQQTLTLSREEALKLLVEVEKARNPPVTEQERTRIARNGRILVRILTGIGLALLAVAVYLIIQNYRFSQQALHVQGEVIEYYEYETYSEEDGTTKNYQPVIQYEVNGKRYTQHGRGSTNTSYLIGEKVDILINPKTPDEILINTFRERWYHPMILIIAAIIFLGFVFLMVRFRSN